jgi:hypothetical protein
MSKKTTYLIWTVLLLITIFSLFFAYEHSKHIAVAPEQNSSTIISTSTLFMDSVSQCPDDTDTSDEYACLYNLADATSKEADALANKLITQAPIRLKEITSTNTGPVSFVYGGSDFLTNLPKQVKNAQTAKDGFINSICNLASMKIYGGSGMDLEQSACHYHFTEEYLQILKNLEGGLTATE